MARKSRKNMMPQAAVQEAVQQNEKELLRTAAYVRLSVENGGHETEDSLHTQILQIHNYIRENPELTLTDTYADNGFTGTRFDRPEFERMMQDVRTGKIQCIVVKDLSRFGRDYIETGSYLETIFPIMMTCSISMTPSIKSALTTRWSSMSRRSRSCTLQAPGKTLVPGTP